MRKSKVRKLVIMAILVSLTAVLSIIDTYISQVFALGTGIKLGIANIVLIVVINYFKFNELLTIGVIKSILVGLLLGTFSTFIIGFSGTMASIVVMTLVKPLLKRGFSYASVSFFGGVSHTLAQLTTVVFYNKIPFQAIIPVSIPLLLTSIITSILVGISATSVIKYTDKNKVFKNI